jgi:hypothetical protein
MQAGVVVVHLLEPLEAAVLVVVGLVQLTPMLLRLEQQILVAAVVVAPRMAPVAELAVPAS